MLKFEVFDFKYVMNACEAIPNDVISYNNGDILFLNKTYKGYYFVSFPLNGTPIPAKEINYLLLENKIYITEEEPVYYA